MFNLGPTFKILLFCNDDDDDNVWKQNSTFAAAPSPFLLFFFLRDGTYCCSVVCYLVGLFGVLFIVAVLQVNVTNTTSV